MHPPPPLQHHCFLSKPQPKCLSHPSPANITKRASCNSYRQPSDTTVLHAHPKSLQPNWLTQLLTSTDHPADQEIIPANTSFAETMIGHRSPAFTSAPCQSPLPAKLQAPCHAYHPVACQETIQVPSPCCPTICIQRWPQRHLPSDWPHTVHRTSSPS
jgi:hypothetical protein